MLITFRTLKRHWYYYGIPADITRTENILGTCNQRFSPYLFYLIPGTVTIFYLFFLRTSALEESQPFLFGSFWSYSSREFSEGLDLFRFN